VLILPEGTCIRSSYLCGEFWSEYGDDIRSALLDHVRLALLSVVLGLVISVPLALLARANPAMRTAVLGLTGAIYTIPSLALFVLLRPFFGVTHLDRALLTALTLYNLLVLVRNLLVGLEEVPADVLDAARGMGYGRGRLLTRVELPLALPAIMAGVRVATVSSVALVTVGAVIGVGGLGDILYVDGFERGLKSAQLTGLVLIVALALAADLVLLAAQRLLTPWARARRA
jgi:osmoprotectant transport system permease protein